MIGIMKLKVRESQSLEREGTDMGGRHRKQVRDRQESLAPGVTSVPADSGA